MGGGKGSGLFDSKGQAGTGFLPGWPGLLRSKGPSPAWGRKSLKFEVFPDHHPYSAGNLERLSREALRQAPRP